MRRFLKLAGLAGGALAGAVFYRRSLRPRRERLEIYFEDGTLSSFGEGSPEAERVLPLARGVIARARS